MSRTIVRQPISRTLWEQHYRLAEDGPAERIGGRTMHRATSALPAAGGAACRR